MFTKFYLISSLLIGVSTASAMDEFIYDFSDSDGESRKPQAMRSDSITSVMSESDLIESSSDLTTSDSGGNDSDGGIRPYKSLKTEYPSPWYKDSVSFNGSPRREPKAPREQWSSEKRRMRKNILAGDFIEETEEKSGKKRIGAFKVINEGITTIYTETSYDNSKGNDHSKKSKLLAPIGQPKIDGFTVRIDEKENWASFVNAQERRASFPVTTQKKSITKGSKKSLTASASGQLKLKFYR